MKSRDRIQFLTGDITGLTVDAVVNAANSSLLGGGGVDGAIHRAGGPAILEECRRIRNTDFPDGLPAGEAVITGGGKLPCRFVIHTVGPVWHGGQKGEAELLKNAYKNSLRLAAEKKLKTIAFPAISTGVYGYPKQKAALTARDALTEFLADNTFPETVILVFFSESDYLVFSSAIQENK